MLDRIWPYLGDIHAVLPAHWSGIVLVICSVVCGMLIGAERESKSKPAGLRTITLICVGSTLFTLASILIASGHSDRARIAAQVVTGVGFLGAGAILQHRGTIIGLTTGATIWTAAAIGVLVGGGYAAAGVVLTFVVVGVLTAVQWTENLVLGECRFAQIHITYAADRGKTRVRLLRVLDEFRIPDSAWTVSPGELPEHETMGIRYCHFHQQHRAFLYELIRTPEIIEIIRERSPRQVNDFVDPSLS